LIIGFLRKASNPVLTYELFDCWTAAALVVDLESRIVCMEKVLDDLLPPANRAMLARLFSCVHLVAQHEKTTHMNSVRLAVILGPILLRDREASKAPGVETMPAVVVRLLLEHYERLFLKRTKEANKIASLLESKEHRANSHDFEKAFTRARYPLLCLPCLFLCAECWLLFFFFLVV
jgi:RhoGAP domain